tara:strand:+ start:593 stop:829 length:237 start_codon:yes stop_codon:yes gene_type:complete
MTIKFEIEKTRLGHVPVGGLFVYNDKLWKKVNRIDGKSKSLVTNIGNGNRVSILLASGAKVCYIIETLDIQEGTNGSY